MRHMVGVAGMAGMVDHRGVVTGGLDRVNQLGGADLCAVLDVGLLDGEVHRRVDTVECVEAAHDPGGAGGATHPGQA